MTTRKILGRAAKAACCAMSVTTYAAHALGQEAQTKPANPELPPVEVTAPVAPAQPSAKKAAVVKKAAPQAKAVVKSKPPQPAEQAAEPSVEPPSEAAAELAALSDAAALAQANAQFQNVPAGVSVMTGREAEARGIGTARDLAQAFSNVTGFDSGGNRMTTFSVRGVHELGYQSSPGVTPSMSYYVDDVPALTSLARASLFSNAAQLSVLKGPQGTLFGSSLPAGVIDIHSAEPYSKPTGYVTASAGNYSAYQAGAGFSTPLGSDAVFLTADLIGQKRDGFFDNVALGEPYGDKEAYAGKAKLTIVPTSRTVVDLILQHERFDDQSDPFLPFSQLSSNDVSYNDPGRERIGQDLQALRVRTRLDGFDLMSVTAHRHSTWDFKNDGDQTASPADPFNPFSRLVGYSQEDVESTTQEFRLKSNDRDSRLQWSAGAFAAHTKMEFDGGTMIYPDIESPYMPLRHATTTSNDAAIFGEVRYDLGAGFTIVPGLRYEWAGRKGENEHSAPYITSASDEFDAVLPSLALLYAPIEGLTTYAKYARGFKPGGYIADRALTSIEEFEFDKETSDNYEIGFKSQPLGGMLTLNGSLFYSRFNDYQVVNQFSPSEFGVNNAQDVESYGGELDANLRLTPEFRLFGGLGVTHAKFDRFSNAYADFSGNKVTFIPAFTANYGFEYRAGWGGYVIVDGRTLGDYYLDEANLGKQDGATIVNATLGYTYGNFDIALFGRNIFDERYVINTYDFAGTGGVGAYGLLGDPATYGVRTKVSF